MGTLQQEEDKSGQVCPALPWCLSSRMSWEPPRRALERNASATQILARLHKDMEESTQLALLLATKMAVSQPQ